MPRSSWLVVRYEMLDARKIVSDKRLSDVAAREGGSGLLGGVEVVRSESWHAEHESWRVSRSAWSGWIA